MVTVTSHCSIWLAIIGNSMVSEFDLSAEELDAFPEDDVKADLYIAPIEALTDTRTLNKRYVPILRREIQPR